MDEQPIPEHSCAVDGCEEPAVVTPRAPTANHVVDVPDGEIVPLCADHAEQAQSPSSPATP